MGLIALRYRLLKKVYRKGRKGSNMKKKICINSLQVIPKTLHTRHIVSFAAGRLHHRKTLCKETDNTTILSWL